MMPHGMGILLNIGSEILCHIFKIKILMDHNICSKKSLMFEKAKDYL